MCLRPLVLGVLSAFLALPSLAVAQPAPETELKVREDDWPWWRGPTLDGKSRDRSAPKRWSSTENIAWKRAVPGRGHSSPVLWGDRLFLTTADDRAGTQSALAFDRKTGKPLWSKQVHKGELPRKYPKNSHASATPACDDRHVYCVFVNDGGLHVTALDHKGNLAWQKKAGSFRSEHGYGSSPVLYRSLVIVNGDSLEGCFLAALDRSTGKVVWRTRRKTTGRHGSYATPLVVTLAGKAQLILTGMGEVCAYEPLTGKLIWSCQGPAEVTANTPACSDKLIFASGGYPEKNLLAIRGDGKGDVTESRIAWRTTRGVTYVPSPLYHDGKLFVVNDGGVVTCFAAGDGKQLWQGRLGGAFSSSPVLVGDHLYVTSEAGKTHVLQTGDRFRVVSANDVGERVYATPAVCGGRIYLRGERTLYCIGK